MPRIRALLLALAAAALLVVVCIALTPDEPSPAVLRDGPGAAAPPPGAGAAAPATQVVLERAPPREESDVPAPGPGRVTAPSELESERRAAELEEVVRRLGGEPVYIEGIDGPGPR